MWNFNEILEDKSNVKDDNNIEKANYQHIFNNSTINFNENHSMFSSEKTIFAYEDDQLFYS